MAVDKAKSSKKTTGPVKKPRHPCAEDAVPVRKPRQPRGRRPKQPYVETDDEASGKENDASHLKQSEDGEPTRKRARTRDLSTSQLTRSTTVSGRPSSAAAMTDSKNDNGVKIKQERDEDGCHQVITVYVGRQNEVFKFSRDDLLQSPVLSGYVRGRSFIMDPDLIEVDSDLFKSVDEFLKAGEFQPCYIPMEGRADFEPGAGSLYGIDGYDAYSAELRRFGKLYILAWRFDIPKMKLLICRKVIAGFPKGSRNNENMLEFIDQIFQDMPGLVENAAADRRKDAKTNDPLKERLIIWLAENMRECTQSLVPGMPKRYGATLDKGIGLSLAVHRAKSQIIEKHKGELVKIEDNEVGGHERVEGD